MEAIKTVKLTKKYGDITAVKDVDLTVERGELFALLGVNGAGKSTVIKMLSCLTEPTGGDAFINGKSVVSQKGDVKKMIAVSPQETAVAQNLSAYENLMLICGIYGFSKEESREKTLKTAGRMGLDSIMGRKAGKLSGGWQRRLSIAMALISDPGILFLDEPTLGLDVLARSELWEIIRSLKGEVTMVLTTHYMEEAEALSDRIGVMGDGRLIGVGTAKSLKEETGTDRFEDAFISIVRGKKE